MIEIPESIILAKQMNHELKNKKIKHVIANASPHKFAWYYGNPANYGELFSGKVIEDAYAYGGKLHIKLSDECGLMFCDGVKIQYYTDKNKLPKKHQLYIEFDDSTYLICGIRMYGGLYGYKGSFHNEYDTQARVKPSIFSDEFDINYFKGLLSGTKPKISVKAFLATDQRIPGLGNGVVQDILFNAEINPKRDMDSLSDKEFRKLFSSVKETISEMISASGRDVETDLYGNKGSYKTKMSKNTYKNPCPKCGGEVTKEAYLGGSIYYCAECQKM